MTAVTGTPKREGGRTQGSPGLSSELARHFSCHILLAKQVTKPARMEGMNNRGHSRHLLQPFSFLPSPAHQGNPPHTGWHPGKTMTYWNGLYKSILIPTPLRCLQSLSSSQAPPAFASLAEENLGNTFILRVNECEGDTPSGDSCILVNT